MKLLSSLFLTVALLISTQVSAIEIKPATCPNGYAELETKFWNKLIGEATEGTEDVLDSIEVNCAIFIPAVPVKEFQNFAMLSYVFTQYPDVIVPWAMDNPHTTFIIRGRITEDRRVEFVKMMYYDNGNLVISTVLISVNKKRLDNAT